MATLSLIGSVTAGYKIWAAVVFALFVVLGKTSWELDHGSASGRIKIPVQPRGRIQFGGRWMQTGGRESPFAQPFPCAPQNLPWDSSAPGEPGLLPVTTANHRVISDSFLTKILKAERERERRGGGNQAHPGNLHLALPNFYVLGLQPWEISFATKFPAQAARTSPPGPPRSPSASTGQDPALPPTAPASAASSIALGSSPNCFIAMLKEGRKK